MKVNNGHRFYNSVAWPRINLYVGEILQSACGEELEPQNVVDATSVNQFKNRLD